jgi:hypothetical protein
MGDYWSIEGRNWYLLLCAVYSTLNPIGSVVVDRKEAFSPQLAAGLRCVLEKLPAFCVEDGVGVLEGVNPRDSARDRCRGIRILAWYGPDAVAVARPPVSQHTTHQSRFCEEPGHNFP